MIKQISEGFGLRTNDLSDHTVLTEHRVRERDYAIGNYLVSGTNTTNQIVGRISSVYENRYYNILEQKKINLRSILFFS